MTPSDSDAPDGDSTLSLTPTMEDYLRHIYLLERTADRGVSNSQVADRLGVSKASVTSMFETLSERELIERERYRPVRLTDIGRTVALELVRKHRLAETLLVEMFDYDIGEVDAEADGLEHHVSDRLCREIERVLGTPTADPHGDPIPDRTLSVSEDSEAASLLDVARGSRVEVRRILARDDDVLDHLVSAGIEPSAVLTLEERTPFEMVTVTVSSDQRRTSLPKNVASKILVGPVNERGHRS